MKTRLQTFLTPPVFDNEEKSLTASLLYALFALVIGISLLLTIPLSFFISPGGWIIGTQGVVGILICIVLAFFVRRGIVRPVAYFLVGAFWALNTWTVFSAGGIHADAFGNFMVIIFATGLLLGPVAGIGITVLSALVGLGAVLAEVNGLLPTDTLGQTPYTLLYSHIVLFTLVVMLQGISARMMRTTLRRARESERQYRSFLENIPAITYINGLAHNSPTTYVSPQVEGLLRYPKQRFLDDPFWWNKLVHPDDLERVERENEHANATGHPFIIDYRLIAQDGEVKWVHDEAVLIRKEKGEPQYWLGVWTDITARKQIETALAQERDLLQALMDNIPDLIYFKDTFSRFIRINQAMVRHLGVIESDQAAGKTDLDFQAPHLAQAFFDEEQEMLKTGNPVIDRLEFNPSQDGQLRWISATKVPLYDEHKKITGLVGISRDVTESKLALQILEKQATELATVARVSAAVSTLLNPAELLQTVVDLTKESFKLYHVHIYLLHEDEQSLFVAAGSGAAGREMQASGWQIPFDHPHSIVARVARTRTGERINDIQETSDFLFNPFLPNTRAELAVPMIVGDQLLGVFDLQSEMIGKFGEDALQVYLALAQQMAVALQNARRYELVQTFNADLETRVQQRTAQLEAANQELESFSYTVSHDLRAPVRAMAGFSSILLEEFAHVLPVEAQGYLQHVRAGAERMGQLVDGLLTFTRLGRQAIVRQRVEVTTIARQVYDEMIETQLGRKITVSMKQLPPSEADPALLRQVYLQLFDNAFKYTQAEPEAHIEVGAFEQNGQHVYFVRDNGIGFDMQYANKLFQVFQQLHLPGEYEGTGIGLALVKRIIEKHHGRIWARAEPGVGATFFFTLEQEPV